MESRLSPEGASACGNSRRGVANGRLLSYSGKIQVRKKKKKEETSSRFNIKRRLPSSSSSCSRLTRRSRAQALRLGTCNEHERRLAAGAGEVSGVRRPVGPAALFYMPPLVPVALSSCRSQAKFATS